MRSLPCSPASNVRQRVSPLPRPVIRPNVRNRRSEGSPVVRPGRSSWLSSRRKGSVPARSASPKAPRAAMHHQLATFRDGVALSCISPHSFARGTPSTNLRNHSLSAGMNVDMLDRHFLLSLAAMAVQRFEQRREMCGCSCCPWRGSSPLHLSADWSASRGESIPSSRRDRRSSDPRACLPAHPADRRRSSPPWWRCKAHSTAGA